MPPEVCHIQNGHFSSQSRATDVWALGSLIMIERSLNDLCFI